LDQYYYYERIELLMLIETGKKSDTQILMFSVISVSSLIGAKRGPFLSEGRHRRLGECLTLPPSGSAPFVIPSRFCSNTRAEDEATAALNSHHTTPASAVHWKKSVIVFLHPSPRAHPLYSVRPLSFSQLCNPCLHFQT